MKDNNDINEDIIVTRSKKRKFNLYELDDNNSMKLQKKYDSDTDSSSSYDSSSDYTDSSSNDYSGSSTTNSYDEEEDNEDYIMIDNKKIIITKLVDDCFNNDPNKKYLSTLSNKDRQILLDKEDEIYNYYSDDIPLRYRIINSNLDIGNKAIIINKIDQYERMRPFDSEYYKLKVWCDNIKKIPFSIYSNNIVSSLNDNSLSSINEYLSNVQYNLNKSLYGQNHVKNKILQIVAQWITNPLSMTQIIAFEGPPGVGKTSLVKNGISIILNKPFSFIPLGGATDSSYLDGHSYTYEGATYGKIVEVLIQSKVMDPIIFFDELDKVSSTPKGEEISGILTHITDTTQNNSFTDKYFSGINFDLSRVLFFFSFNEIEQINPILRDRLTIIKFDNYSIKDKINIAKNYILPDIFNNINIDSNIIIFNDNILSYIIEKYTNNEKGVRQLKKCLEEIIQKFNLLNLVNISPNNVYLDFHLKNFNIPFVLNKNNIDILLSDLKIINKYDIIQHLYL